MPRRPQPGTAAGVGDRALLRVEKTDETEGTPYRGRVIKVIDRARTRLLGIFRKLPVAVADWCPSTRNRPDAS